MNEVMDAERYPFLPFKDYAAANNMLRYSKEAHQAFPETVCCCRNDIILNGTFQTVIVVKGLEIEHHSIQCAPNGVYRAFVSIAGTGYALRHAFLIKLYSELI